MKRTLLIAAAAFVATAPLARAASLPFREFKSAKGEILTDAKGMTLYTFDKDKHGVSACYGECAEDWPPYMAAAGAKPSGPYSLVARKGGETQWAFDGMPLYYWEGDNAGGQTTGDGVHGVWHVVPLAQSAAAGGSSGGSW